MQGLICPRIQAERLELTRRRSIPMDPQQPNAAPCTSSRVLAAVGMGAVAMYGAKVLINVFGPRPQFTMRSPGVPLDSEEFVRFLSLLTDGTRRRSRLKRLKNGDE